MSRRGSKRKSIGRPKRRSRRTSRNISKRKSRRTSKKMSRRKSIRESKRKSRRTQRGGEKCLTHITVNDMAAIGIENEYPKIIVTSLSQEKLIPIGSFYVDNEIAMGDVDYFTKPVKSGMYYAYKGDYAMIITDKPSVKKLGSWDRWKLSKGAIGVDSGRFGAYNKKIIDEVQDKYPMGAANDVNIPTFKFRDDTEYIVTKNDIEDPKMKKTDKNNVPFGVISSTDGDGFFPVYENDNSVMLIGIRVND